MSDKEDCYFVPTTGDLIGVDPKLEPLEDNGGPTLTHALVSGSLAINGGDPDGYTDYLGYPLTIDQRGFPRYGRCDIGAYEWQPQGAGPNMIYPPYVTRSCPSMLLFDDFSKPSSVWPILDDAETRYEYLNNEYRMLVKQTNLWAGARTGFKASDYVAIVDVRNATGIDESYGILFGISDDWTQFYIFEIDSSGYYAVWRTVSNNWALLASGYSGSIHPGNSTNQLKVERNGSQIWVYANGQLLNIIENGNYTGLRSAGLIAISYDQPNLDARFDNFTVYPITCGASSAFPDQSGVYSGEILDFAPLKNWESNPHRGR